MRACVCAVWGASEEDAWMEAMWVGDMQVKGAFPGKQRSPMIQSVHALRTHAPEGARARLCRATCERRLKGEPRGASMKMHAHIITSQRPSRDVRTKAAPTHNVADRTTDRPGGGSKSSGDDAGSERVDGILGRRGWGGGATYIFFFFFFLLFLFF